VQRASLAALGLSASLVTVAGCSRGVDEPPAPIMVPPTLTAPCIHDKDPQTVGELYEAYADARLGLAECNERMEAIRGLQTQQKKP
jgi:hypothetical protein